MEYQRLNPLALALTTCILAGMAAFFAGLLAFWLYTGKPFVTMFGSMYFTVIPTLTNVCIGTGLVIVAGFLAAYIFSCVYNLVLDFL
ncbi:hypothetical protein Lbir_2962 [Legionella birminghamensis]|uniref:Transmembrane protein n=1 Tax=Legionella birminghamensis TaxID=28083 RepID=A0A378I832_9GAMM|nr:hypothetical protein [Legionella birminghamensis]KTC68360.1 hypothetical protein Lbir_2962 [Legionella birminghamensis]STX30925.1 Uncharacterised protein [Legionella birminghamensis]